MYHRGHRVGEEPSGSKEQWHTEAIAATSLCNSFIVMGNTDVHSWINTGQAWINVEHLW